MAGHTVPPPLFPSTRSFCFLPCHPRVEHVQTSSVRTMVVAAKCHLKLRADLQRRNALAKMWCTVTIHFVVDAEGAKPTCSTFNDTSSLRSWTVTPRDVNAVIGIRPIVGTRTVPRWVLVACPWKTVPDDDGAENRTLATRYNDP